MAATAGRQNLKVQQGVALLSIVLFIVKLWAWWVTRSVAILTDALESIVNVVAGLVGLYSLYISNKPRDTDHPYGHGKVEFISAAIEGTCICIAGLFLIYKSIQSIIVPTAVERLGQGIILVAATGAINFVVGYLALKTGTKNKSLALSSSGKHLMTDAYSTAGIIIGLVLLYITGFAWIDSAVALFFAGYIVFMGFKILRSSVSGIMDEADDHLIGEMLETINGKRRINWIDLHNFRVIKYGALLHVDCHITVPWYFNVDEAHQELEELGALVQDKYGDTIELFVHADGCKEFSCKICHKGDCPVRKHAYEKTIVWTLDNIRSNRKHSIES